MYYYCNSTKHRTYNAYHRNIVSHATTKKNKYLSDYHQREEKGLSYRKQIARKMLTLYEGINSNPVTL